MSSSDPSRLETLAEIAAVDARFLTDVLEGLSATPKMIPSKYFYDETGSQLFDRITEQPEYYLTRTELAIMRQNIGSIVECLGSAVVLIEYGSGSSVKTRLLLDHLDGKSTYVPIDISGDHLQRIAEELHRDYPRLNVVPLHADYSVPVVLPVLEGRKVVYYPGSTIGNFEPEEAIDFLRRMSRIVGNRGAVLIGVDLEKDDEVLYAAYNDSGGVTAEFNLNILRRVNRELGADFDVQGFGHRALYDHVQGRVEMHLVSLADQEVHVGGKSFAFEYGEHVHTENSYKYRFEQFADLAAAAGFSVEKEWADDRMWFCVALLVPGIL